MNQLVSVILIGILYCSAGAIGEPDPFCSSALDEKETFYPDPYDCSKYWECYSGTKYVMSCPDDMYWNQAAQYCDFKDQVTCNPLPEPEPSSTSNGPTDPTAATSASPVTTEGPSTTPGPPTTPKDGRCIGKPDGTFLPDEYDCAVFYECVRGDASMMHCPPGTLWNQELQTCDFPDNVNCNTTSSTPAF